MQFAWPYIALFVLYLLIYAECSKKRVIYRNRCIWKKLPGCSAIHYSYDYTDRLVFSQDGNQRAAGECTFQFYDIYGRTG